MEKIELAKRKWIVTSVCLLWGIAAGMASPVQTAVNARLHIAVGSPLVAALLSFTSGTLLLLLVTLIADRGFRFNRRFFHQTYWWQWLGGPLGVIFVLSNILLLPLLGSALTVVAILCGQMMIALIIDHFGWFGVPCHKINWQRLAGLALMVAGIILIQHF
ncbi:DMT family transporter [Terrilactibacillus sp. S3-3]|nr:DMT family transporter [Terrilactibacillus sp. S3-3]